LYLSKNIGGIIYAYDGAFASLKDIVPAVAPFEKVISVINKQFPLPGEAKTSNPV